MTVGISTIVGMMVAGLMGAVIVVLALVGRKEARPPRCRACRYTLGEAIGAQPPPRCPECGASLESSKTVLKTVRVRSRGTLVTGVVLLLPAVAVIGTYGVSTARGVDWIRHWPTVAVIRMVESDVNDARAWTELERRLDGGRVSRRQQDRIFAALEPTLTGNLPGLFRTFQPWFGTLDRVTGDDIDGVRRRGRLADLFPPLTVSAEAIGPFRLGKIGQLRIAVESEFPLRTMKQFRVVEVRQGHTRLGGGPVLGYGGSVGIGGTSRYSITRHLDLAPLGEAGPTELTIVIDELTYAVTTQDVGHDLIVEWSRSFIEFDAAVTDLEAVEEARILAEQRQYGAPVLGLLYASDPTGVDRQLGALLATRRHELRVPVEIEAASDTGVVHPRLFGGDDNFTVRSAQVRLAADRSEVILDVIGPRSVPVAYNALIIPAKPDGSSPGWSAKGLDVIVLSPVAEGDPSQRISITTGPLGDWVTRRPFSIVLVPCWRIQQAAGHDWPRIWGRQIIVRDVIVESVDADH